MQVNVPESVDLGTVLVMIFSIINGFFCGFIFSNQSKRDRRWSWWMILKALIPYFVLLLLLFIGLTGTFHNFRFNSMALAFIIFHGIGWCYADFCLKLSRTR